MRAAARHRAVLEARDWQDVELIAADALDPATLPAALQDIDVAFYLVHSMAAGKDFAELDVEAAKNFAAAAAGATHVCLRRVEPKRIFDAIVANRITHMCGAPIVLNTLSNAADELKQGIDHKVRVMTAGAAPPAAGSARWGRTAAGPGTRRRPAPRSPVRPPRYWPS